MDEIRPVTDDASARAWLEREARMHQQVLTDIERQMLPLAHDDELRGILEDTRRTVQSHLTRARQLLGQAGTAMDTTREKTGMDAPGQMNMQAQPRTPGDTSRTRMPSDTTGHRPY
jgi:hypothetical protein